MHNDPSYVNIIGFPELQAVVEPDWSKAGYGMVQEDLKLDSTLEAADPRGIAVDVMTPPKSSPVMTTSSPKGVTIGNSYQHQATPISSDSDGFMQRLQEDDVQQDKCSSFSCRRQ